MARFPVLSVLVLSNMLTLNRIFFWDVRLIHTEEKKPSTFHHNVQTVLPEKVKLLPPGALINLPSLLVWQMTLYK